MTREKAVKIIKEFINGTRLHTVDQEALETLIPELTESEDERIIKTLQEYVKNRNWPLNGPTQDEAFAWLGNQKEQKPADNVSEEKYVKRFKALCDAYEIKLPNREYDIYHLCHDLSKLSIDYGKQKPADLSEMIVHKEPDIVPVPTPMVADEQKPVDYEAELKKCKDNPLYFFNKYVSIKLKPMKWSEEDEEMLQSIIKDFRAGKVSTIGQEQWLKSLPERFVFQPKQEWGKDKNKLDKIHSTVQRFLKTTK